MSHDQLMPIKMINNSKKTMEFYKKTIKKFKKTCKKLTKVKNTV